MSNSFNSKSALQTAVNAWITNETNLTSTYGDINKWDVRAITDFSRLFNDKSTFINILVIRMLVRLKVLEIFSTKIKALIKTLGKGM